MLAAWAKSTGQRAGQPNPIAQLRVLSVSLRVLAMRELFGIPLFGSAMRMIGMIEVDRKSPDFGEIDTEAARDLVAGHCLLAYPEGSISPDGTIGEFKDGAFIIAVTGQVPVAIQGTRRIWPPGRRAIHVGQVRVVAGSPLPTSGLTHLDVAGLRDRARDVIYSAHRALVSAMEPPGVSDRQGPWSGTGDQRPFSFTGSRHYLAIGDG